MEFKKFGYTVKVSDSEIYVDNKARGRSGHMSHAMAEFAPACFIDFNSNCSANRIDGHSTYGWIEYRISRDSGKSYSEPKPLPYSFDEFLDGVHTISVEKAVAHNGNIIALCLRNSALDDLCCSDWDTPTAVISRDGGESWEAPREISPYPGRIYDARVYNGDIYFLESCSKTFFGAGPWCSHYRLFKSTDGGESFECVSIIPINYFKRAYGAMIFDGNGALHVYVYNESNERELDHVVSYDLGKTWEPKPPCYMKHGLRNPQINYLGGLYFMHGRGMCARNFLLYTSTDGESWDEGTFLVDDPYLTGFYSNNILLRDEKGEFLLIQNSESYNGSRVNVMHRTVRVTEP